MHYCTPVGTLRVSTTYDAFISFPPVFLSLVDVKCSHVSSFSSASAYSLSTSLFRLFTSSFSSLFLSLFHFFLYLTLSSLVPSRPCERP